MPFVLEQKPETLELKMEIALGPGKAQMIGGRGQVYSEKRSVYLLENTRTEVSIVP